MTLLPAAPPQGAVSAPRTPWAVGGHPRTPALRCPRRPRTAAVLRRRGDRGQVAIEYIGLLPLLLLIGLCTVQLGLAVYAVQQAGTAARAAARVASQAHASTGYQAAGQAAISDWLTAGITQTGATSDTVQVTVRVDVPSIVPGISFGSATRSVTMPRD